MADPGQGIATGMDEPPRSNPEEEGEEPWRHELTWRRCEGEYGVGSVIVSTTGLRLAAVDEPGSAGAPGCW